MASFGVHTYRHGHVFFCNVREKLWKGSDQCFLLSLFSLFVLCFFLSLEIVLLYCFNPEISASVSRVGTDICASGVI